MKSGLCYIYVFHFTLCLVNASEQRAEFLQASTEGRLKRFQLLQKATKYNNA